MRIGGTHFQVLTPHTPSNFRSLSPEVLRLDRELIYHHDVSARINTCLVPEWYKKSKDEEMRRGLLRN